MAVFLNEVKPRAQTKLIKGTGVLGYLSECPLSQMLPCRNEAQLHEGAKSSSGTSVQQGRHERRLAISRLQSPNRYVSPVNKVNSLASPDSVYPYDKLSHAS